MLQKRYPLSNVVSLDEPLDIAPVEYTDLLTFVLNIISTYYY